MTERARTQETNDSNQVARQYFRLWLGEQRERKRLQTEMRLAIITLSSVHTLKRPTHGDVMERLRAVVALLETALQDDG